MGNLSVCTVPKNWDFFLRKLLISGAPGREKGGSLQNTVYDVIRPSRDPKWYFSIPLYPPPEYLSNDIWFVEVIRSRSPAIKIITESEMAFEIFEIFQTSPSGEMAATGGILKISKKKCHDIWFLYMVLYGFIWFLYGIYGILGKTIKIRYARHVTQN